MRKFIAVTSIIVIVMVMGMKSMAANESGASIFPGLSFSGTTATCSLKVYAEHVTDSIVATVTLKHGSSTVRQWTNLTVAGIMNFSDTATVS